MPSASIVSAAIQMSLVGIGVPCFFQMIEDSGIEVGGFFCRTVNLHAGGCEKGFEKLAFIAAKRGLRVESGFDFRIDDKRNGDSGRAVERLSRGVIRPFENLNDRVGVEKQGTIHFHISASMVRLVAVNSRQLVSSISFAAP